MTLFKLLTDPIQADYNGVDVVLRLTPLQYAALCTFVDEHSFLATIDQHGFLNEFVQTANNLNVKTDV
jgi:hypothetical protein